MPSNNNSRLRLTAWLSALFLVVLGAKLWVIRVYGTALPYWDQWDEAKLLFKPWLEGHSTWGAWFGPHNEHRIFFTRALDVLELWLNGQWDPLLQMVVNAFMHAGYACGLAYGLWALGGRRQAGRLVFLLMPFFGFPFAAENTLHGFQSQIYFLGMLSVVTMAGLGFGRPGGRWWWCGLGAGVLSLFTMGSGLLAVAAVGGLMVLRVMKQKGITRNQMITAGASLAVLLLGLSLTITIERHKFLQAKSVSMFMEVLLGNLAWPFMHQPVMLLIMGLPLLITLVKYFRSDFEDPRAAEFVLTLGFWGGLQATALAYGRAVEFNNRYLDTLSTFPIASLASLFILGEKMEFRWWSRRLATMLAIFWVGILFWGLARVSWTTLGNYQTEDNYLQWSRLCGLLEEENVRAFVATENPGCLLNQPVSVIQYWDPAGLIGLLRDPQLSAILPPSCRPPLKLEKDGKSDATFILDGYPPDRPKPEFSRVWGSYATNGAEATGVFISRPLSAALPKLIVPVCCGPGQEGIRLQFVEQQTARAIELHPETSGRWHSLIVSAPHNPFRLEIADQSRHSWVAVGEIQELGRLSFYTLSLLDHAVAVLLAGLGLWVLLAGISVARRGMGLDNGGLVEGLIFLAGLIALAGVWTERNFDPAGLTSKLYQVLAVDCVRRGDLPGVERHLRQALWQQPDNPEAFVTLANVIQCDPAWETNRAREQAVLYYEAALRLKPDDAEARQQLNKTLQELGRQDTPAR